MPPTFGVSCARPGSAQGLATLRLRTSRLKNLSYRISALQQGGGMTLSMAAPSPCPYLSSTDMSSSQLIVRACRSVERMQPEGSFLFRRTAGQASAQFFRKMYLRTAKTAATLCFEQPALRHRYDDCRPPATTRRDTASRWPVLPKCRQHATEGNAEHSPELCPTSNDSTLLLPIQGLMISAQCRKNQARF